jgi:hypothetical protein
MVRLGVVSPGSLGEQVAYFLVGSRLEILVPQPDSKERVRCTCADDIVGLAKEFEAGRGGCNRYGDYQASWLLLS